MQKPAYINIECYYRRSICVVIDGIEYEQLIING